MNYMLCLVTDGLSQGTWNLPLKIPKYNSFFSEFSFLLLLVFFFFVVFIYSSVFLFVCVFQIAIDTVCLFVLVITIIVFVRMCGVLFFKDTSFSTIFFYLSEWNKCFHIVCRYFGSCLRACLDITRLHSTFFFFFILELNKEEIKQLNITQLDKSFTKYRIFG